MNVRSLRIALLSAALLASGSVVAEDLTILSKVTFGNDESDSTTYISTEYIKASGRDAESIIHFPTGKLTMVDKKKKEYWETTIEEMEAFWEKTGRELRRSGAADMFGLRDAAKMEKLSGARKIAGYDCEHWSLEVGDVLEVDFWAAPALAPPARYYDARKLSGAAMGPMGQLFEKMYEELKKAKGYPLSTAIIIRTPVSRTETLDEATEVRKGPIPPGTFDVPSGYKKVNSPFPK